MADNIDITPGTGRTIATDQIGTIDYQLIKLAYGALDSATLVSTANGLPVGYINASLASTAFSASDAVVAAPIGDGTLVTGASTAGSIVSIAVPDGLIAWTLLIKGYVSGTIYTEASNNSTNGTDGDWVEVKGRRTGTAPGTESVVYAMVANGYYRGNAAGFKYLRARLIGATGPTIGWQLSKGQGATFLNSGIPAGSSNIGTVSVATESTATFRGRATSFRAVGRAGTAPRRLMTIFNAAASGKVVHINKIDIDLVQTAAMAVTVIPPVVRIYRITAAATGGTACTKVAKDSNLTSSASITVTGDASADGTNSATALAATTTAGSAIAQEFAARLITAAGYEPFDKEEFLVGWDVVLRPSEGLCISLDLTLATQDPATSNWVVGVDWWEA